MILVYFGGDADAEMILPHVPRVGEIVKFQLYGPSYEVIGVGWGLANPEAPQATVLLKERP